MAVLTYIEVMQIGIIPAAFILDAVLGDPRWLPHPVRWMGRAIEICEPIFRRYLKSECLAGSLFASSLILGCWGLTAMATHAARMLHPAVGVGVQVVLLFFCLSARSLSAAGMEIYRLLRAGRVDVARSKLSLIVGRDVARYGADDISRATVETVAENFVDGVLSPLFFVALGGVPLAMAYKMINTLDSMVGYKNERYQRFGWAAARVDDLANFIPARLAIVIIALAARMLAGDKGRQVLITAMKEGAHHRSPNAGYPEAAFAGALAVKLNGPNQYGGVLVDKPHIGVAFGAAGRHHIRKACALMMFATLIATVLSWAASLAWL